MDPGETKIFFAILLAAGIIGFIILLFGIVIAWSRKRIDFLQHKQHAKDITELEHERKRIVSELHDELGPLLSVVKIQVANLDTTLKQDIELIRKATDHLDEVLKCIRNICSELAPTVLSSKGLFIAINQLIEEFSSLVPIKIEFIYAPVSIEPSTEIHIYRMLQELITNAVKHSGATTLNIVITPRDHMLLITVADDGNGFYPDKTFLESNGLGLKNILSRAHALKGNVFLESEPAKGTFYKIEIPIQVKSEKGDGRLEMGDTFNL